MSDNNGSCGCGGAASDVTYRILSCGVPEQRPTELRPTDVTYRLLSDASFLDRPVKRPSPAVAAHIGCACSEAARQSMAMPILGQVMFGQVVAAPGAPGQDGGGQVSPRPADQRTVYMPPGARRSGTVNAGNRPVTPQRSTDRGASTLAQRRAAMRPGQGGGLRVNAPPGVTPSGAIAPTNPYAYQQWLAERGETRIRVTDPEAVERAYADVPLTDADYEYAARYEEASMSPEDAAALAEVQAVVAWLATLSPDDAWAVIAANPWLLDLLVDLGFVELPPEGTFMAGVSMEDVKRADDVFSSVWDSVKSVVPFGNVIDVAHQARREAMWGPQMTPDAVVREMQDISRKARKGDPAAREAVSSLRAQASRGDETARRKWKVYTVVTRDDLAAIDAAV